MPAAFPPPLFTLLTLALLLCAADAQLGGIVGGWSPANVTETTTALLNRALTNESSYRADVTTRVCVFEIRSLSQQVVAGTNYRFEAQACRVASAKNAGGCAGKSLTTTASVCDEYAIQLYEQVWTSTLEVTSIERLGGAPNPSPSPSPSSITDAVGKDDDVVKTPAPSSTPQSAAPSRTSHAMVVLMSGVAFALAI